MLRHLPAAVLAGLVSPSLQDAVIIHAQMSHCHGLRPGVCLRRNLMGYMPI